MMNEPVIFTVAPITRLPAVLQNRHRFAGDHGFINRTDPVEHHAIDRYFFTRTDPQSIAGLHLIQRNVAFRAIAKNARGVGTEIEQRPNGGASAAAGAEFEYLAQEHESHDGGRGLEVDRRRAVHVAERRRE